MIDQRHKLTGCCLVLAAVLLASDSLSIADPNVFTQHGLDFDKLLVIQRRELNPSHVYTYHYEDFKPGGGLYVFTPGDAEIQTLVDSPEGQILDCDLSHDAKEIVFSWKKSETEPYQVYLIDIDGTSLKQITDGPSYNFNACWLPDGDIAFLSTRKPAFAYCWTSPVGTLYRMNRHGNNIRRLSANYLNDFTPAVLNDGRIIYGRWEYVDRPAIPIQSLWTINPDGTTLGVYYGNRVLSPATFIEPQAIPGSGSILCTLTAHNGPCRGAIGIIDPLHGVNAQQAIRNLTPEVDIGKVSLGNGNRVRGPYESPYPLDDKYLLLSRRGTIVLRDYDGTMEVELLGPRDNLGFYCPRPIRPRPRPPVRNSALTEQDGDWATVILQDVYKGLEPYVRRGEVKQICVVQEIEKSQFADKKYRVFGFQFPVVSCGATYSPKKVWGYASVDEDGSACFKVPAGVPIYFMALDAEGRAVQRMRSFTHLVPGEVHGCIGCHEPRSHTSRMQRRPTAAMRQPQELQPPEWGEGGFSYAHIVQPVLDRHCVKCHNARSKPKGVDLSGDKTDFFNVSYETLARQGTVAVNADAGGVKVGSGREGANPYTSWIATYNGAEHNILKVTPKTWGSPASSLADIVLCGHPGENGKPKVKLDEASRRRILAWIDLNVPYYGTSTSNYYDRRGCRQMVPSEFGEVLQDVAQRRCAGCHDADDKGKVRIPREFYLRITNPQLNGFLVAPLAKSAGGTETCGPVFKSTDDPDYQAILKTFEQLDEMLELTPRMDMVKGLPPVPKCELSPAVAPVYH
ncbi:MAG: HzsA-related protein [Planctomycetota bacterium]|jgi:cytochrome c553